MKNRKLTNENKAMLKRLQFLREQLKSLDEATMTKKMADVMKLTSEVMPKNMAAINEAADLMDTIREAQDEISVAQEAILGNESNESDHLESVLADIDMLPDVPQSEPKMMVEELCVSFQTNRSIRLKGTSTVIHNLAAIGRILIHHKVTQSLELDMILHLLVDQ